MVSDASSGKSIEWPHQLHTWLLAQQILQEEIPRLPAEFPRPDWLVAPADEAELQNWCDMEERRRGRLDAAVRHWLTHRTWPDGLDGTDGWLLHVRLSMASQWLELGAAGCIQAEHYHLLLVALLLEGWEAFRAQYVEQLRYRMS